MSTDDQPHVDQDVNASGDYNQQYVAGRDLIIGATVNGPASRQEKEPQSHSLDRWLGMVAIGGLLGFSVPLVASFSGDARTSVRATPIVAASLYSGSTAGSSSHVSPPERIAEKSRADQGRPASTSAPWEVARVSYKVPAPLSSVSEPAEWPDGKSALCRNGTFSASRSRAGTCSRNHGVAHWRYPPDHPYWRAVS